MKIQVSIKLSLFFFWNIDYLKLNLEASIFILSSVLIGEEFIDYCFFCSSINIIRYSNLFTIYKTKSQSITFWFIQVARTVLIDRLNPYISNLIFSFSYLNFCFTKSVHINTKNSLESFTFPFWLRKLSSLCFSTVYGFDDIYFCDISFREIGVHKSISYHDNQLSLFSFILHKEFFRLSKGCYLIGSWITRVRDFICHL
nr:MAG TPA: hypothetical protein [Caudoviricetes sp.]